MKKIALFLFVLIVCTVSIVLGQDSTVVADPTTSTVAIGVWGWVAIAAGFLLSTVTAAQLALKKIPTAKSEKIGGILGMIANILTFFVQDKKKDGGVH